jgi:AcrR family transcriptional regulator
MPRPRVHDLHRLLDAAERLIAEVGTSGLTVRGLAAVANVPNGTIYHAFGSMGALTAQVWLRAAGDFLDLQTELVDQAIGETPAVDTPPARTPAADTAATGSAKAVDAVIAAADAPAVFAARRPAAARMLLTVKQEELLGPHLPGELADAVLALDKQVVSLLTRLTHLVWQRRDARAVEVLTTCVVDLPAAFFRRALTGPIAGVALTGPADGHPRTGPTDRHALTVPADRHPLIGPAAGPAVPIGAEARERLAAAVRAVLAVGPPPARTHRRTTTTKE